MSKIQWRPIETAPDAERVLVCGWQEKSKNVIGYWWWHEDVCFDGKPTERPEATYWFPVLKPDFPPNPKGDET